MNIPLWARRSALAAGLMMAAGHAWSAPTTYDLLVNHDGFQIVAGGEAGEIGTGEAKVDGPVGGQFVYRAKARINAGTGSVSEAVLTQKLPAGALFQEIVAPAGVICTPSLAVGTSIIEGDSISCTIPVLTHEFQNIDFKVILPSAGNSHVASASLTAPDNNDPNGDNHNNLTRNITTYERADLAVAFIGPAADSTHQQGDVVNYEIQVSNTDSEYAYPLKAGEKAVVRFSLPAGTAFHDSPSSEDDAWNCTEGVDTSATPPVAYQECSYTAPVGGVEKDTDLPWLKIPVIVQDKDGGSTALVSVAGKTTGDVTFVDAYPDNNSDEVSITFAPNNQLDMRLDKSVFPPTVDAAATASVPVSYTLNATRNSGGLKPALPISITDELPEHITYTGSSGTDWRCSATGQIVNCQLDSADNISEEGVLPELKINATVAVDSIALTDGKAVINNTAKLSVDNEPVENKSLNNQSTAALTVSNITELVIDKSTTTSVIAQGQEFSYTIGVKNNGPVNVGTANVITVTDELDAQFEYIPDSTAEAPWTCNVSPSTWSASTPQTVTCTLSEGLAVDASKDLSIKVKAHLSGGAQWATIGNEATVSCPTGRVCPGWTDGKYLTNNPTVNISKVYSDLSITKKAEITPDSSSYSDNASGVEVVYTLKVKNAVPNPLPEGKTAADFQTAKTVTVTDNIVQLLNNNKDTDFTVNAETGKPANAHPVTGTERYSNGRFVEAVYLDESYPAGMSVQNCTYSKGSGTLATRVTCTLNDVPVGDTEYGIRIRARQYVNPASNDVQENSIINTAYVSSADTADLNLKNNDAKATVDLKALTNMTVQKQASVEQAAAGQKIDFTLSAANHGPSQATAAHVVDTLPLGMIWVSAPTFTGGGSPSCSLSGGETIAAGLIVTEANRIMTCAWNTAFAGGTSGATRGVTYSMRSPNVDYPASVTNNAYVNTTTQETIPLSAENTDNRTSKTISLDQPKLNVLINMGHTEDGLPINDGEPSKTNYTITVTNSGESTSYASNVQMFDHFPAEGSTAVFGEPVLNSVSLTSGFNRFTTDNCEFVTEPRNGLQCNFDWLAPGESVAINFTMSATGINNGDIPVGTITHQASVSADGEVLDEGVDVEADNYVTDRTSAYDGSQISPSDLGQYVDLSVTKDVISVSSSEPLKVDDEIEYRITVKNESTTYPQASTATVTDVLPRGLELVGTAPGGCTYASATRTLTCTIPATPGLAAGAHTSFDFTAKVASLVHGQDAIENTATLNNPNDPNPSNNTDKTTNPSEPAPVTAVPVDNPLALLALILGMGLLVRWYYSRRQLHI